MITHEYEEYKPVRQIWTWLIIILVTILTLGWGMVTHMAVPDVPRQWDFDTLPDTPAMSPYSTVRPPRMREAPTQMEPAPTRPNPGSQQW
jgi:hypothetical protein